MIMKKNKLLFIIILLFFLCLCCAVVGVASYFFIHYYQSRNNDEILQNPIQNTDKYDGSSDKTTTDGRFKIDEGNSFKLYYPSTYQFKQLMIEKADRFKDPDEGSFGVHNYIEGAVGYFFEPSGVDEYLQSRGSKALEECKFQADMELDAREQIFDPLEQKLIEYGVSKNPEVYGCYFTIGDSQEQHEYYYVSPAIDNGGTQRMYYRIELSYATDEEKEELDLLHEAVAKFTMLYAFETPLNESVEVGTVK